MHNLRVAIPGNDRKVGATVKALAVIDTRAKSAKRSRCNYLDWLSDRILRDRREPTPEPSKPQIRYSGLAAEEHLRIEEPAPEYKTERGKPE